MLPSAKYLLDKHEDWSSNSQCPSKNSKGWAVSVAMGLLNLRLLRAQMEGCLRLVGFGPSSSSARDLFPREQDEGGRAGSPSVVP